MKKKKLPSQFYLQLDFEYDPETGILTRNDFEAGYENSRGYREVTYQNRVYYAHRLIWKYMTNEDPDTIDHINGDRRDNRWNNLRNVSAKINLQNKKSFKGENGLNGINFCHVRNKWLVTISHNCKHIYIGGYLTPLDAIQSRIEAEEIFWDKSHAHTNKEFKDRLRQHLLRGH